MGTAKDQYGKPLPKRFYLLTCLPSDLTVAELERVDRARWYETDDGCGPFVPVSDVGRLDRLGLPTYYALELPVARIADALKRWNDVDGFYHA